jgi:SAM-dependent methyltransferase
MQAALPLTDVEATHWWDRLVACPGCGGSIHAAGECDRGRCGGCSLEWARSHNVWRWGPDTPDDSDLRRLPAEWIAGRQAAGGRKWLFLGERAVWSAAKVVGLPVRALLKRRLAAFQARSVVDRALAEEWRRHYLNRLDLPAGSLIFEYSYRKIEKLGFAALLGYRMAVQDIRPHPWWRDFPDASFHVVPPDLRRLPLDTAVMDLAFTDGAIFDIDASGLGHVFGEFLRILKPGGHLVVWAGNSLSRSRARSEMRWHGRIHSLAEVRRATRHAGFVEVDVAFEGYAPPVFGTVFNMLRGALAPWPFKTYDHDSWLARLQRPDRRAYWLLRLAKPRLPLEVGP